MKLRSWAAFGKLLASGGVGTYFGLAATGLVTLLTGHLPTHTPWATTVPVLALLGAAAGRPVAHLSRHWLADQLPHRNQWLMLAGAVTLPLVTAVHAATPSLTTVLAGGGWLTTLTLYHRAVRQRRHTPRRSPALR